MADDQDLFTPDPEPDFPTDSPDLEPESEELTAPEPPAPDAPVAAAVSGKHLDYRAGESLWRVERAEELLAHFTIQLDQVPEWHKALVGQGQKWEIIRRYFGVGPCVTDDPEQWRARDCVAIGKELGLTGPAVQGEIEHAGILYAQLRMLGGGDQKVRQMEESFGIHRALDAEAAAEILGRYGFGQLEDDRERMWAAQRLREMQHLLDVEEAKSIVMNAIRQELAINWYDEEISKVRARARDVTTVGVTSKARDEIQKLRKEQQATITQHQVTMKALGATQAQQPSQRAKMQFQDSVGFMIEGAQKFMAEGDNALIDGMFTAAEVQLLCKPYLERAPQYRPDICIQTYFAAQRFWDPDYEGNKLSRDWTRKLKAAWGRVFEDIAEGADESLEDWDKAEEENEFKEATAAPEGGGDVGMGEVTAAAVHPVVNTDDLVAAG